MKKTRTLNWGDIERMEMEICKGNSGYECKNRVVRGYERCSFCYRNKTQSFKRPKTEKSLFAKTGSINPTVKLYK